MGGTSHAAFCPVPPPTASPEAGRPAAFAPYYLGQLRDSSAVERATIPVEKTRGPILLVSGTDDHMWPSTALADIAMRHYPLRLSVRRSLGHCTRFVIDQVLAVHGFSLKDVESWGGSIHYVDAPNEPERYQAIREGALDAVFDEGVKGWGYVALDNGMQFLDLDEKSRARLGDLGWPMGPVRAYFPKQREEIMAVSFGGWPLFTRASLPEGVAYQMCHALDSARERIAWSDALNGRSTGAGRVRRFPPVHPQRLPEFGGWWPDRPTRPSPPGVCCG